MAWPAIAALGGTIFSALMARNEAERNRRFQERMSSTAHQREVLDLKNAGLHPALSAMRGSGASTPGGAVADTPDFGESVSRGVATALAVKQVRAQIALTESQADQAAAAAQLSRTQAADISTTGASGRYRELASRADISEAEASVIVERLRAEISQLHSAAAQSAANAELLKLQKTGQANIAQLEKYLGTKSPAFRLLMEALRGLAPFKGRN